MLSVAVHTATDLRVLIFHACEGSLIGEDLGSDGEVRF